MVNGHHFRYWNNSYYALSKYAGPENETKWRQPKLVFIDNLNVKRKEGDETDFE